MASHPLVRRQLLRGGFAAGAGVAALSFVPTRARADAKDVSAVEDLMREHGILRRALLVYSECASRLLAGSAGVDPGALNRTARLFKSFGEQYHESRLEEGFIFPALRSLGSSMANYADVLTAQHARGREITAYILDATAPGRVADAMTLAGALDGFVRMYRHHAAREDTIVFPAWKQALSGRQLDEMGENFEEIEKRQFGGDGFEQAAKQMADIEVALRLDALASFTAPPPPKR